MSIRGNLHRGDAGYPWIFIHLQREGIVEFHYNSQFPIFVSYVKFRNLRVCRKFLSERNYMQREKLCESIEIIIITNVYKHK